MIQDVLDKAGYLMRGYQEEKMQAMSCPFPDEVVDRETGKMMY